MSLFRKSVPRSRGFSMIEVMVAVFVLSIGLLGMAALMATSLRNNQSADLRSQAVNLAYDQLEMIRSNVVNANAYNRPYSDPDASCAGAEVPFPYGSATELYSEDRNYWARRVCRQLPNGRGRVTVTGGTVTGGYVDGYDVQIDVCWTDNRSAGDQAAACPDLAVGAYGNCSDGGLGATCVIRIETKI